MRKTVHQFLTSQVALTALVPQAAWYQAGAVVDVPVRPFVVLRWLAPVRLAAGFGHQLRIDMHDERGSYSNIDLFRKAITPILTNTVGLTGVDGYVAEFSYLGHGGDNEDELFNTNLGYTSWQVIGAES